MIKKIITYTILPVIATGIFASLIGETITGKKKEKDPHLPHQEFSDPSSFRQFYVTSLQSSASVVEDWTNYIKH